LYNPDRDMYHIAPVPSGFSWSHIWCT